MLLILKLNRTIECTTESMLALARSCVEERTRGRTNIGAGTKTDRLRGGGNARPTSPRLVDSFCFRPNFLMISMRKELFVLSVTLATQAN